MLTDVMGKEYCIHWRMVRNPAPIQGPRPGLPVRPTTVAVPGASLKERQAIGLFTAYH